MKAVAHYVGRNTFPIYIFHPIFTMLAKFTLPAFAFEPTGLLHAAVSVAMGVIGSIYLARALDYTRTSYPIWPQQADKIGLKDAVGA